MSAKVEGGEDILLDEFDRRFGNVDAYTQLVLVCEVCRRPSNRECAICGMKMCDFCGRKQHWKGKWGLHWPMVQVDMYKRQAKQELDDKKEADARRRMLEDPNHRDERQKEDERHLLRERRHAAQEKDGAVGVYSRSLARYYAWAQTDAMVIVAVWCPNFGKGKRFELGLESGKRFVVQSTDEAKGVKEPPVVDRLLAHDIALDRPADVLQGTEASGMFQVRMHKANAGEHWSRLFLGDPDGVRCLVPPWRMTEGVDDVVLEIDCPHWVQADDVSVEFTDEEFTCKVAGHIETWRTYWKQPPESQRNKPKCDLHMPVDTPECLWSLEDEEDEHGADKKVLMLNFVRPEPTPGEIEWKKGKRDDNRSVGGSGEMKGVRFFADDHDVFGLEPWLMAHCFKEAGRTFVPFDFKDRRQLPSRWVSDRHDLPPGAQRALEQLEAIEHRVSEGQTLEDWEKNGPNAPKQADSDWDRHERKVENMQGQFSSMAEKMEAMLAKQGL